MRSGTVLRFDSKIWLCVPLLLLIPLMAVQQGAASAGASAVTVQHAVKGCTAHPDARLTLGVRGYFVANSLGYGFDEGELFPTSKVPAGNTDQWALHGGWKHFGAIRVRITEDNPDAHHVIANTWLTVHGSLNCSTQTLRNDADPFPRASPTPTPPATPVPNGAYHRMLSAAEMRSICRAHPSKVSRVVATGFQFFETPPYGRPPGFLYDHAVKVPDLGGSPPNAGQVLMYDDSEVLYLPWQGTWIVLHGMLHCDPRGIYVEMDSWRLTDAPSPAAGPTATPPPGPTPTPVSVTRQASNGEIEFSLTAPGGRLPANALVRVTLEVHNASNRDIGVEPSCDSRNPGAYVSGVTGAENYLPPVLHRDCVPSHFLLLKKGARLTRTEYLILRGPDVGADVHIRTPASAFWPHYIEVQTEPIHVELLPATSPSLSLVHKPGLHVVLPSGSGPYLYTDAWRCPDNKSGGHASWTHAGSTLKPGCAHPVSWSVAAGIPSQSVAFLDY